MIWKEQFVHFANKIDYHNFRLFAKCCFMTTSNTCNIINYLNSNPKIFDLLIKWYFSIILASNKAATRRASLPSLIIPLTLCEDSRKVWLISIIFLTNSHRMCQIIWNLLLKFLIHFVTVYIHACISMISVYILLFFLPYPSPKSTDWLTIPIKVWLVNFIIKISYLSFFVFLTFIIWFLKNTIILIILLSLTFLPRSWN